MIKKLRQEGYSYKEISESLRVPINTVKSYSRRKGLTGSHNKKKHICLNCGYEIDDKKKFCSATCRQTWWNNHLDKVNLKSYDSFTCKYCHKLFNAHGNKHRKYCSHECYIKDRFHHEYKYGVSINTGSINTGSGFRFFRSYLFFAIFFANTR